MTSGTKTSKAQIIDGKALAAQVRDQLKKRIAALRAKGKAVRLDAILASHDSAAAIYARNQASTCAEVGIEYHLQELEARTGENGFADIAGRVLLMNADESVSAIMVHLPLPNGVDTERVQSLIAIDKDVEGVNPA